MVGLALAVAVALEAILATAATEPMVRMVAMALAVEV